MIALPAKRAVSTAKQFWAGPVGPLTVAKLVGQLLPGADQARGPAPGPPCLRPSAKPPVLLALKAPGPVGRGGNGGRLGQAVEVRQGERSERAL